MFEDLLIVLYETAGPAVLVSQVLKLGWLVAGWLAIMGCLRLFDILRGQAFRKVPEGSIELQMYLGLRFLGTCIYFGLGMSAAILIAVSSVVQLTPAAEARSIPRLYDRQIEQAAKTWLPGVPWKLWKAQLYQESRLDPDARSPVGAEGLAQFMPATWREISAAMGVAAVDRRTADASIQAGAFYMARLRRNWSSPRPETDRHDLAMASYNAGIGHILAAQRACEMAVLYAQIMACLPQITGRHAAETLGYAPAIRRWHLRLEAGA